MACFVVAIAMAIGSLCAEAEGAQSGDEVPAAIVAAWQRRSEKARSFEVTWKEERFDFRGSQVNSTAERPDISQPVGTVTPPEDLRYDVSVRLVVDGTRMRFGFKGQREWSVLAKRIVATDFVSACDGTECRRLYSPGVLAYPHAELHAPDDYQEAQTLWARPVLLHFRMGEPRLGGIAPNDLKVLPDRGQIDGRECLLIQPRGLDATGLVPTFWVDVERAASVVRYVEAVSGRVTSQADTEFDPHPQFGWIPSAWRLQEFKIDGRPTRSCREKVERWKFNEPVADEEFQINFPLGTWIDDLRSKDGVSLISLQQPNGLRPVGPEELRSGATYDDLLHSERGKALQLERPMSAARKISIAVTAVVAAILFVLVVYKRVWQQLESN